MTDRSEFSILIGGKAGFGIDKAGSIIGGILNRFGYYVYIYRDYPSLIRGGHTFSIVRASRERVSSHRNKVDFVLALNQDTVDIHKEKLKSDSVIIYDSDSVKSAGYGIPVGRIIKEENASEIMRNSCIIGGFCKSAAIPWDILEQVFRKDMARESELNLKVALKGYGNTKETIRIEPVSSQKKPLITGNEAIGMGLIKAGLGAYIAYPMTPSSGILHFMANVAEEFGLKVIHPESEISVILMALGFACAGTKAAVGTSGGGFCLMTEGLSFAGMAELPVLIIVGQRPGPSTGLPTYTSQTELRFALSAGQGEFPRLVVAPGDAEEAYYWSGVSLNLSWKYQIPSIILSDKTLAEGTYNFDPELIAGVGAEGPYLWDNKGPYKRYLNTETGVSGMAFVPAKDGIIKINSYEHDETGITTEDPATIKVMQEKRMRKGYGLTKELEQYETVKTYGRKDARRAILCWGSNKGVCIEAANNLGLRVIQPQVLNPFPINRFREAIKGVERLVCVENNSDGQLAGLVGCHGFRVDDKIQRYDGRPFAVEELEENVRKVII